MALQWLTAEFMQRCLGDEVEVTDISCSEAVPPGHNYGSVVTRVSVRLKHQVKPLSVIIKSEVTSEKNMLAFLSDSNAEYGFYYKFLPEAGKIMETPFFPKFFPSTRPTTILLEDLREQGFSVAERTKQLDFEHCRLYVTAAAAFHAVAFVVHKSHPELVEELSKEKIFAEKHKNEEFAKQTIANSLKTFRESVRKLEKFHHVCDILDVDPNTYWKMMVEANKPRKTGINTLIQGDPWITNMMFKYDENGAVIEIKMIDFQALRYSSPVLDVTFFIWTSANNDVRNDRVKELFHVYVETFNDKMQELGCSEKFTLEGFMDEVNNVSPHSIYYVMASVPFTRYPGPVDIEKFASQRKTEDNFFAKYYTDDFCSNQLPQILTQLDNLGTFEAFNRLKNKT